MRLFQSFEKNLLIYWNMYFHYLRDSAVYSSAASTTSKPLVWGGVVARGKVYSNSLHQLFSRGTFKYMIAQIDDRCQDLVVHRVVVRI